MRKRLFPLVIALSALAVSGSAAFYSVFGLSKLFAGASLQVIIMAGSLEFAKLVAASLLYQYWGTINKVLRAYLAIAVFVLILITSGGIYGFLSGAYQETATKSELLDKSLAILNQKQIRFQEVKEDLSIEKTQLNKSISELRISLSNPGSVSYYDKEADQVITTTSSSTRRALQSELKSTIADRDAVNIKLESILDSISTTDMALLDKEVDNEAERELGPLKYLAEVTGKDMSIVVNWFLLLIIFVFDPLAISLVIAANFAFSQIKRREPEIKMSVPAGMEFNTPYPMPKEWYQPSPQLKQRVKENQDKLSQKIKIEKRDLVVDDLEENITEMPEETLEEERLLDFQDANPIEGQAFAKGLDTLIEVFEEEEKDEIKDKKEAGPDQTPEHELYHGKDKEENSAKGDLKIDVPLGGNIKKRIVKKKKRTVRKPPRGYGYKG